MNKVQTSGQSCQAATLDTRSSSILGDLANGFFAAVGVIAAWHDRWQQRRSLAELDSRLLSDIGLEPYEARRETRKPFWVA